MGKPRNKKTQKKLLKLREFASNSYSYLQVVGLQCKLKDRDTTEIEGLVNRMMADQDMVRANSLKMIYTLLRDQGNILPQVQERVLKRFIEKQMSRLKEMQDEPEVMSETYSELLAAHKELAELTTTLGDKLSYLSQANRLADMQL